MSNSDPSQPFEADDIIYTKEAAARIKYLLDLIRPLDDEEQDELENLLSLRDAAVSAWGTVAWHKGTSLVAGSYWGTYAQEQAEDIYGGAARTEFWDEEKWQAAMQENFIEVPFSGNSYWGDDRP